jgi:hypothetical protein
MTLSIMVESLCLCLRHTYAECQLCLVSQIGLSAQCRYAECHYAECHYAECRGAIFATVSMTKKQKFYIAETLQNQNWRLNCVHRITFKIKNKFLLRNITKTYPNYNSKFYKEDNCFTIIGPGAILTTLNFS